MKSWQLGYRSNGTMLLPAWPLNETAVGLLLPQAKTSAISTAQFLAIAIRTQVQYPVGTPSSGPCWFPLEMGLTSLQFVPINPKSKRNRLSD